MTMDARRLARVSALALALAASITGEARSADWSTRGAGTEVEAGTLVDGEFAGLLLRCGTDGERELRLTHNGAVFDRDGLYTMVLSVDGIAFMSTVRAVPGEREGDDDFVRSEADGDLGPIVGALTRGSSVEVSAPSGRYTIGLSGSSAAIAAFEAGCP